MRRHVHNPPGVRRWLWTLGVMRTRLALRRVFLSACVAFLLWQTFQSAASRSWAEAAMQLGFACSGLAAALRPSYLFGPAVPSLAELRALPPLSGSAATLVWVGTLFLVAALVIWLAT